MVGIIRNDSNKITDNGDDSSGFKGGNLNQLGSVLFMTAWGVGVASWFFGIAESIGMWRFWPWVFGTGLRVWTENSSLPFQTLAIGSEIETESGKIKVVSPNLCLFRWRMRWFSFDIHTPFPIKGSLKWDGNQTTIEGRIPLFTTLFFAAWLIGWTVGGVMAGLQSKSSFDNVGFTLIGWAFAAGMFSFSIPLEKRRAKEVLSEYEYYVAARNREKNRGVSNTQKIE